MSARQITRSARAGLGALMLVMFTASTPVWLIAVCAAASLPLIPLAVPGLEVEGGRRRG